MSGRAWRGRRSAPTVALLSLSLLATAALTSCTGSSDPGAGPATTTATATDTTALRVADASWEPLAPSPLANRAGFVTVPIDGGYFVCCGSPHDASGAAPGEPGAAVYELATNTWRVAAQPPPGVESWGAIVTVGTRIYFLDGGTAPWTYAAYDLAADRWQPLPPPPANDDRIPDSRLGPAAWTGTEIVAPISTRPASDHDLVLVAYAPSTGTWRTLPAPPVRLEPTSLLYDGTNLQLLGEVRDAQRHDSTIVSATFDPAANEWRTPETTPIERRDAEVVDRGDGLVAWDVSGAVRVHTPEGWRDLPPVPFPEDECGWKGADVGSRLAMFRCTQQGAVLDTRSGTWEVLPPPPVPLQDAGIVPQPDGLLLWSLDQDRLTPYLLRLG